MKVTDRAKRVGLHLPVSVSGESAGGRSFSESTRSLNVSGGGICFESRQKLLIGQRLMLRIQLPAGLRRHFGGRAMYEAQAVVCRVEQFEGEAVARIGARFLAEVAR
jgi:hypothetical protein